MTIGNPAVPPGLEVLASFYKQLDEFLEDIETSVEHDLLHMNAADPAMPVRYAGIRGQREAVLSLRRQIDDAYLAIINPKGEQQ